MASNNSSPLVVVTGANGHLGSHCVLALLHRGYSVRGTVRDLTKQQWLYSIHPRAHTHLELVEADLLKDKTQAGLAWAQAFAGAEFVLHTASPTTASPKVMVQTAVDGASRVTSAAAKAGVRRVVFTSSITAVWQASRKVISGWNIARQHVKRVLKRRRFEEPHAVDIADENRNAKKVYEVQADAGKFLKLFDTTNKKTAARGTKTYINSKIAAEQAMWRQAEQHGIELSVVVPPYMLGPVLHEQHASSVPGMVKAVLRGDPIDSARVARSFHITKTMCHLSYAAPFCDVRDAARAHVDLIEFPEASQRLLLTEAPHHLNEVVDTLNAEFGCGAPLFISRTDHCAKLRPSRFDDDPARLVYTANGKNLEYTPFVESVLDTASSLVEVGALPRDAHKTRTWRRNAVDWTNPELKLQSAAEYTEC